MFVTSTLALTKLFPGFSDETELISDPSQKKFSAFARFYLYLDPNVLTPPGEGGVTPFGLGEKCLIKADRCTDFIRFARVTVGEL